MSKTTKLMQLLFLIAALSHQIYAQSPVSHPNLVWDKQERHSDEFENLDLNKWENDPNDWGVWSWDPSLVYIENNELKIKMVQDTHRRNTHYGQNEELYYKSGIIRNNNTITYGYFETKIKGADRFPGVCPAFWLYSINQPDPTEDGQAKYCEIDVVELTQKEWDFDKNEWEGPEAIDMNLHAVAREGGKLVQIRPHGKPELAQNKWYADFDPREDYHTYGVLSRVDSIFWYVDGVERGRKENLYWHLPMHITVSMGLRNPFVKYVDGVRYPVADSTTTVGFPTEMSCQYVRVWKAIPQIYIKVSDYENSEFGQSSGINFKGFFDAGSGYVSTSEMTINLVEVNNNNEEVSVVSSSKATIKNKAAGEVSSFISLKNVTLSDELESGHSYQLRAYFYSSQDERKEVHLTSPIKNIQVVDQVTSLEKDLGSNLQLIPNPVSNAFKIIGLSNTCYFEILDISGEVLFKGNTDANKEVDVSQLSSGLYIVKLNCDDVISAKRLLKL